MFGIFGAILGAIGFINSSSSQKSAEEQERRYAKSRKWKTYTDSHGVQRNVTTNKPVPVNIACPKPIVKVPTGRMKHRIICYDYHKIPYSSDEKKQISAIKEFDDLLEAWHYYNEHYLCAIPPKGMKYELISVTEYEYK